MAEAKEKSGTQIRLRAPTGFSPADAGTDWTRGTPTDYDLSLSGVGNNAGRQSEKIDLGATRAPRYEVLAAVHFTAAPSAVGYGEFFWAPSTNSVTGNGNVAGNSGNDAAAPDGALGGITLDEFIRLCKPINKLFTHDGADVQNGYVGILVPPTQWGQLIVVNRHGGAYASSNAEMHVVLDPIIGDIT